jgi:hypothetical protein
MLVEMEKWRRHIEHNLLPQNTISWRGKPVRPRMEKRDSGAAPLCRRSFEVFHAPENLLAPMTKRSAEHPVSRQENGLEIAREQRASGWVFQEVWRSGTRFQLIPAVATWSGTKPNFLWSSFSGAEAPSFLRAIGLYSA